jgi:Uncharacterized protein conserved in bacteria
MERNKIYFASDLHLGSNVLSDSRETERKFVHWLDEIKKDAKILYLLGDVFDFWFEYKKVVPRGFVRFLGKIAELNDAGVEIHFFTGNHDIWIFDYLPDETGVIVHKDPITVNHDGKVFFLAHGDGLGDNSRAFKLIRSVFHNQFCQGIFSLLPTRWGIGLAQKWSKSSRKKGLSETPEYLGEDKEHLILFAKKYLKEHPEIDFFVFGHRHIMLDLMLNHKSRILILGDWIRHFSYAVFDGEELKLDIFED